MNIIYQGTDGEFEIDLGTYVFDDLIDIIVGLKLNGSVVKICRKTFTGEKSVEAISGEPNKCVCRIFRAETAKWCIGKLEMEITAVITNTNFPNNMHSLGVAEVATVKPFQTANQ